jgi:hypothetical protein
MFDLIYCGRIVPITDVESYGPETSKSINARESTVSKKSFVAARKNAELDTSL